MARLAVVIAACLVGACASGSSRDGPPPPLEVRAGDVRILVHVGTHCAGNACADAIVTDGPLLRMRTGDTLSYTWDWGPARAELTLCEGFEFDDCGVLASHDSGLPGGWALDVEPGRYRMSAFITGTGGGDASYDWKLLVVPDRTRQS